jgi:hypothetical protein
VVNDFISGHKHATACMGDVTSPMHVGRHLSFSRQNDMSPRLMFGYYLVLVLGSDHKQTIENHSD